MANDIHEQDNYLEPDDTQETVKSSVSRINDELEVGADLRFQNRWWKFERVVWAVFAVLVALDIAGALGRGYLANTSQDASDRSLHIEYERVARFRTPSLLSVSVGPSASKGNNVELWVSESIVKPLGNQRIVPQPATSTFDREGILYRFPVRGTHNSVEFALEPSVIGPHRFQVEVPGFARLSGTVFVVP